MYGDIIVIVNGSFMHEKGNECSEAAEILPEPWACSVLSQLFICRARIVLPSREPLPSD